ncbi:MAG: hypothetical protein KME16_01080 [Scytolyngbya sp. HA4215-MV1]|jgi:hypothetical protein|nr:hypothetical protein [Scytolyngbya sp. HA4215-MV1]
MELESQNRCAFRIGVFDNSGFPISISKNSSAYATVAFQVISLEILLSRSLELGGAKFVHVRNEDGSKIRIEKTLEGFIGYLEAEEKTMQSSYSLSIAS